MDIEVVFGQCWDVTVDALEFEVRWRLASDMDMSFSYANFINCCLLLNIGQSIVPAIWFGWLHVGHRRVALHGVSL